ncbi:hypothetical protein CTI12_AA522580 [Artemisia annua]|uniref:Uncharacterized protein n=1 Tax=Artemisia annua TaxID=35608 RepID=A0A2U1L7C3_ARTAN|nr:hypothetical protein CTI12_AA522580 [Artemisia annua]
MSLLPSSFTTTTLLSLTQSQSSTRTHSTSSPSLFSSSHSPTLFQLLIFSTDDVTTILQTLTTFKTLTALIAVIISTVTGVATITYTAHRTMRRRPVTFTSTFKSLSSSFTPLLSTFVAGLINLTLISFIIGTLLGLGFHFGKIRVSCYLAVVSLLFVVTSGLAPPFAVLESKYGFESLRESLKNQSAGLWLCFFWLVTFTIYVIGTILRSCAFVKNKDSVPSGVAMLVLCNMYLLVSLHMVQYVVATVVLCVIACKAARGGDVVVNTRMRVSSEDRMVHMLGWFTHVITISLLIMLISALCLA